MASKSLWTNTGTDLLRRESYRVRNALSGSSCQSGYFDGNKVQVLFQVRFGSGPNSISGMYLQASIMMEGRAKTIN
jgi:hypothetical protein